MQFFPSNEKNEKSRNIGKKNFFVLQKKIIIYNDSYVIVNVCI